MLVQVIEQHDGEGQFETFAKGSQITDLAPCQYFKHWSSCKINGVSTYVPDYYVANDELLYDYNPTELVVKGGEVLEVLQVSYSWQLVCCQESKQIGWIPAEKVISIKINNINISCD
jgi:hypothetical protein